MGACAALIISAVAVAYANSLHGDFHFSDHNVIVNNPAVHSWGGWLETMRHLGIRPLLKFTYTLSWTMGLGVMGFHLFNVAVHGACSLLVYDLARRCLGAWVPGRGGDGTLPALAAALLFAVHPVHTEAVTYISGRSSSLMALFFLGSLLAYARGAEGGWRWSRIVSPVLFMAAVATKEVAVVLPFGLLLWDRLVEEKPFSRSIKDLWVHWVVLAALMGIILTHQRYLTLLLFSSELRGMHENLVSQIDGMWYLLSRLAFVNSLSIDPDIRPAAVMDLMRWLKVAALGCAAAITMLLRGTRPWVLFSLIWFVLVLVPSNSIIARLDVVNERHLYLADVGVVIALASEGAAVMHRSPGTRRAVAGCAVACLCILCVFTIMRNAQYRDGVSLWESTVRNSPYKARGYNNLGVAYEQAGLRQKAVFAYRRALELDPLHQNARANLGRMKMEEGPLPAPSGRQR